MDPALWLLLRLRLGGWRRRLIRSLGTVKGAFFVLLGSLLIVLWLLPTFLLAKPAIPEHLAAVRQYGPLALVAYVLLTLVTNAGEQAVSFSPAEVEFLFTGPFSRRQLLGYKLLSTFMGILLSGLLFTVIFRPHYVWAVAAFVGAVLALLFVQLLTMAVVLIGSTVGIRIFSWGRKIALVLFIGLAVAVGFQVSEAIGRRHEQPAVVGRAAWESALEPMRVFVEAFTAERLWPELVRWALLALAIDGFLLGVVFFLDANYLETAAAAGERAYARRQRLRSGAGLWGQLQSRKARFSIPTLPWWGGVGSIAWRQLIAAARNPIAVLYVFGLLTVMAVAGVAAGSHEEEAGFAALTVGGSMVIMTLLLNPLIAFDFRGELDRMEVLKTLPIVPWRLAVGQLLTPVLLVTGMETVLTAGALAFLPRFNPWLPLIPVFAAPFNFFLFGIENLLFLWFPFRLTHVTPGDLQGMGRLMLFFALKAIALGVLLGVVVLLAALVYWVPVALHWWNSWIPALATAWLALALFGAAPIPLIAAAFQRFDVAGDTPPP